MACKLAVWFVAVSLIVCGTVGSAQDNAPYYAVRTLSTLGGSDGSASSINETGWITGSANMAGDKYSGSVLWVGGHTLPVAALGGPNSSVSWPNHNDFGLIAGISETPQIDPLGEDWSCQAFFPTAPDTKHVCRGFAWRNGKSLALSPLGGINSYAAGTNEWGQIVGWAETTVHDSTCTAVSHFPNSFYQVLQFEPIVWRPDGSRQRLPTLQGDPDGAATAVNDLGQAVGISGACDQAVGRFTAAHAVIWENGNVANLGNFGGVSWNTPTAVNNRGEVVGFANLPGDTKGQFQPVGFVWTKGRRLRQIPPLPGDTNCVANGINNLGQVVGQSFNTLKNTARAFIWENGKSVDLNGFVPPASPLYLLSANDIDDHGDIVGQALVQGTSEEPGFVAIPPHGWDPARIKSARLASAPPSLSETLRFQLLHRFDVRTGKI